MLDSKIIGVLRKFFESKFLDWSGIIVFSLITLINVVEVMQIPFISDPYPDFILYISGILFFSAPLLLSLYLIGFCFGVRHKTRMLLFFLFLTYAIFMGYMIYELLHMDWGI